MEVRELTCVACPMGCQMTASIDNGVVVSVTGNTCPRGKKYAETECTHPVRPLTTTVKVDGGKHPVVPVKSADAVPKEKMFDCMKVLNEVVVKAPVKIGDVIVENICDTGINIVATNIC
ncbi:MAG: DUF1667 domain-containing protein [Clostridia bacterium]|nr:DUF1667 domain-containing protein [Clostridia bacterium]